MRNLILGVLVLFCCVSCNNDDDISVDAGIRSDNFVDCLRPIAQNYLDDSDRNARITLYSCSNCDDGMVFITSPGDPRGSGDEGSEARNLDCDTFCILNGIEGNSLEDCVNDAVLIEVVWEDPR